MHHRPPTLIKRLHNAAVPLPVVIFIVLFMTVAGVFAATGTTDSPAAPGATNSYTLENIYARLNTYTIGAQSTFTEPVAAPGVGTMHTLNDIYTLLDLRAFVPKTGVTKCYGIVQTAPIILRGEIACAGTGQDGEYQRGIT